MRPTGLAIKTFFQSSKALGESDQRSSGTILRLVLAHPFGTPYRSRLRYR